MFKRSKKEDNDFGFSNSDYSFKEETSNKKAMFITILVFVFIIIIVFIIAYAITGNKGTTKPVEPTIETVDSIEEKPFISEDYFKESLGLSSREDLEHYFSTRGMEYKDVDSVSSAESVLQELRNKGEKTDSFEGLDITTNQTPSEEKETVIFIYGESSSKGYSNSELRSLLLKLKEENPEVELNGYSLDGIDTWRSYYSMFLTKKDDTFTGGVNFKETTPQLYIINKNVINEEMMFKYFKGQPLLDTLSLEKVGVYQ